MNQEESKSFNSLAQETRNQAQNGGVRTVRNRFQGFLPPKVAAAASDLPNCLNALFCRGVMLSFFSTHGLNLKAI